MHNIVRTTAAAIVVLAGAGALRAAAEDGSGTLLKGKAAFGSWRQDKPGLRRLIKPQDLPPVGKSTPNFSEVAPVPPGAKPRAPPGFLAEMVASGYASPRAIRVAPNGDLFVADSASNTIRVLRVPSGTASPTKNEVFASALTQPFGIAFYPLGPNPEWIYVANNDGVVRFPYKNGDLIATGKPEQIVGHIPWVHHWTRDIAFTPDGKRLLLSVGSGSNVALDMFPEPEVKGGLQAWIKSEPLGAGWDTEERRADVLPTIPTARTRRSWRRACATAPASPFSRRPAFPGASSTSAMSSATTRHSNMPPRSRSARSTVGPGTTSDPTRTRATKARGRT